MSQLVPQPLPDMYRHAVRLEYFTIAWNTLEALVAILFGFLAGSIALIGFGFDSIIEVISGATLLWRLRQRGDPESEAESKALRIVGLTFFLLAAYISYESIADLWFRRRRRKAGSGLSWLRCLLLLCRYWDAASVGWRANSAAEH